MQWTLKGKLRCGAVLDEGGAKFPAIQGHSDDRMLVLQLDNPRIIGVKRGITGSEFDVKLRFQASDWNQAHDRGVRYAQEVSAALAFLASAPAEVQIASVTTAPDEPIPGTDYTTLIYPDKMANVPPPTTVPAQDMAFVLLGKPERVRRALRWIQKSHLTDNAVDEFTCLMVAFESLSHLLKAGGTRYWRCSKCESDIMQCPQCGESTELKMSGVEAMREFAVQTLGWTDKDWTTVWGWRCRLLHGETDISVDEEHAVISFLPALEEAVVAAIKKLTGLAPGHSPARGRFRPAFGEAVLQINWHK